MGLIGRWMIGATGSLRRITRTDTLTLAKSLSECKLGFAIDAGVRWKEVSQVSTEPKLERVAFLDLRIKEAQRLLWITEAEGDYETARLIRAWTWGDQVEAIQARTEVVRADENSSREKP